VHTTKNRRAPGHVIAVGRDRGGASETDPPFATELGSTWVGEAVGKCYPSRTTTFSDERLDVRFAPALRSDDLDALRAQAGVKYGVFPDVRIGHPNPAWFRFASANGGEADVALRRGVGAGISDAMSSAVATQ
jgi:hypothetical protein